MQESPRNLLKRDVLYHGLLGLQVIHIALTPGG